jgi:hypothetical protein
MRNNLDRLGIPNQDQKQADDAAAALMQSLSFVVPTEHVDLPSKGLFYSEGHPLHQKDTIEIRYMTAKDEDTLTSRNLLKKGIAVERLLQDLIVDKRITLDQLLIGDKNAIIVAARKTAYGAEYNTKVSCPSCGKTQTYEFDLDSCKIYEGYSHEDLEEVSITQTETGTFIGTLPILKAPVEIRLLSGKDEQMILQRQKQAQESKNSLDTMLSDQLKLMVVSINGVTDQKTLYQAVPLLPAKDSIYIRDMYKSVNPTLDLSHDFACSSCSFETRLEVPFTADFFWPKR